MIQDKSQKMNVMIGERLRLARKASSLTQKDLAEKLGFKSRQILDNIESGMRKVGADELMVIMNVLGRTLDYFTDPFMVLGDKVFAWRVDRTSCSVGEYESKARNLVGAFRHFCEMLGDPPSPLTTTLNITTKSSYEDVQAAGQRLVKDLHFGEIPALKLAKQAEQTLGVHILYVDAPQGISGAACHLDDMRFILINRNEPLGRRNYDLAHELFHVLTWNQIPPDKIELGFMQKKAPRAEQLADIFASALLLPEDSLIKFWNSNSFTDLHEKINVTASHFLVTSIALKYRLKNLNILTDIDVMNIDDSRLKWGDDGEKPLLYSKAFVKKLHTILDKGLVSVRKVAVLLDCTIDDLQEIVMSYGLKNPFDLQETNDARK